MRTMPLSRAIVAAFVFAFCAGWAHAQDDVARAQQAWDAYLEAQGEDEALEAARALIGERDAALAVLDAALDEAADDGERLDITYFIALVLSQERLPPGEHASLPPDLADKLASLLETSDEVALHGNIANIAAMAGPSAAAAAPGLLDLLRRTSATRTFARRRRSPSA